jgi:hypothetical protein
MRKVTMMLADHAAVADGKLYINGGGWTEVGHNMPPYAIVLLLEIPWDEGNNHHEFRLELEDADGQPVMVTREDGKEEPRFIAGGFDSGRPPGMTRGTPIPAPFAILNPPELLEPGKRYVWRLEWNGETQDDWRLAFNTRAEVAAQQAG